MVVKAGPVRKEAGFRADPGQGFLVDPGDTPVGVELERAPHHGVPEDQTFKAIAVTCYAAKL
jgi:hypothetical protein